MIPSKKPPRRHYLRHSIFYPAMTENVSGVLLLAEFPRSIHTSRHVGTNDSVPMSALAMVGSSTFFQFRGYPSPIQFAMPELDRCAMPSTPGSSRPALRQPSASPLRP